MTSKHNLRFESLSLRAELLTSVSSLDYTTMTPIQAAVLPVVLERSDVLAQAKTGSGKTAAFSLALLNKLDIQSYKTQALVLCPTRELSDQVANEIRRLASGLANTKVLTLCGGKPMQAQLASLKRDAHVIVGTPGRILKHLDKGSLNLDDVQTLVLDEADRMLDMGFFDDIRRILAKTDTNRQTLLFSATYPDEIRKISAAIQVNPVEVRAEEQHQEEQIQQVFHAVSETRKTQALLTILDTCQPESCIVFCNRKQQCQLLSNTLRDHGYHAKALHGDLEQYERDESMILFANSSVSILVATDVAARGLDIDSLSAVINFDLAHDAETHVHRIGRTGRAGNTGLAISLVLPQEQFRVDAIEKYLGIAIDIEELDISDKPKSKPALPKTVTLRINAGKKDKIRPGDIVGALTADAALNKEQIGKITVQDKSTYVAVVRTQAKQALELLSNGKIKGRRFKVKALR